ncbi:unnamed protein product, partial [Owenia fusiformis]
EEMDSKAEHECINIKQENLNTANYQEYSNNDFTIIQESIYVESTEIKQEHLFGCTTKNEILEPKDEVNEDYLSKEDYSNEDYVSNVDDVAVELDIKKEPLDIVSETNTNLALEEIRGCEVEPNVILNSAEHIERGAVILDDLSNSEHDMNDRRDHTLEISSETLNKSIESFRCEICGKCYSIKNDLDKHALKHTRERPFHCHVCEKSFTSSLLLKRHILNLHSDSGEKPFKCKNCSKSFLWSSKLKVHERIHTGERPLQCKVCGKCFNNLGSFGIHQLTHSGKKTINVETVSNAF